MKIENAFYELNSRLSSRTFHASPELPLGAGTEVVYQLSSADFSAWKFPIRFVHSGGRMLTDLLDTRWPTLYLIADRMTSALRSHELTGWRTFPILLQDKNGEDVPGYSGLSISGRTGPLDIDRSEIVRKRLVPEGPISTYYRGLYFEMDDWDKSDFFMPLPYYGTFVTARAADVIKAGRFTNTELRHLEGIELPEMTASLIRHDAALFRKRT